MARHSTRTAQLPTITLPMPYELLRETFGYLASDPRSLNALSISSSCFTQEAQRILFEDVDTTDWQYKKLLNFSRTIAASPDCLVLYVHAYTLEYVKRPEDPGVCAEFLNTMRDCLDAMRNLKYLEINILDTFGPSVHGIARELLRGCTFSLETLEWTHASNEGDTEELFENFLPKQRNLKHLGIDSLRSLYAYMKRTRPILSLICPELTSLRGPWVFIKAMLPGRKIVEINIINSYADEPPIDAEVRSLVPELERIEHFSCSLSCFPEGMVGILQHCLSVEVIGLVHFLEGTHDNLLYALPKFPALETIGLSLDLAYLPLIRPPEKQREFTCSVFESHGKNLQFIDIMIGDDEDTCVCYTRPNSENDTSDPEGRESNF